jgi:hypothetical protein
MKLIAIAPDSADQLSGRCRKFALEALERAKEQGRFVTLQGQQGESDFELVFAVSVHPDQAKIINQGACLYHEPAAYLDELKRKSQ